MKNILEKTIVTVFALGELLLCTLLLPFFVLSLLYTKEPDAHW